MPITPETLHFLGENRLHDSRDWFQAHKAEYKALVEEPMLELARQIGPAAARIDPAITTEPRRTLSRIWRDVRFSKDKTTFREVMWLVFRREKGMVYPAFFIEFSPVSFRYGCGYYSAPPAVMDRLRGQVLADDKRYLAAQKALDALPGFEVAGETYARPRYADQPQAKRAWLERRGISVLKNETDRELLFSPALGDEMGRVFERLAPVYRFFLDAHLDWTLNG